MEPGTLVILTDVTPNFATVAEEATLASVERMGDQHEVARLKYSAAEGDRIRLSLTDPVADPLAELA